MKYERQLHSTLFIVLQEKKKKDGENIYSRAETSFIHSLERKYMQVYAGCLYAASDRPVELCRKSPL